MTERNAIDPNDPRVQNRATLLRVGFLFAVAMLIASMMQPVFFAGSLSSMLFFGAVGAVIVALFLRERPLGSDRLTRWDEAAMLVLLSLVVGSFADPEAMRAALEQMQQQQNAAVSGTASQAADAGATTGGGSHGTG